MVKSTGRVYYLQTCEKSQIVIVQNIQNTQCEKDMNAMFDLRIDHMECQPHAGLVALRGNLYTC